MKPVIEGDDNAHNNNPSGPKNTTNNAHFSVMLIISILSGRFHYDTTRFYNDTTNIHNDTTNIRNDTTNIRNDTTIALDT